MILKKIAADLHTHSTASDGDCASAEVVLHVRDLGLEAMALTDHDTLAGLEEALAAGDAYGLRVICGVEVSLRFNRPILRGSLHYLLYFPSSMLHDPGFRAAVEEIIQKGRGHQLVKERVAAINDLFGQRGEVEPILKRPLTVGEVEAQAENITRRHFADVLEQRHGLDREQVNRLISNSSPAYVPSGIEMELLKPLFERYPITRVLAHPAAGSFPKPSVYREVLPPVETVEKILPEFLALGLDGLEIYYPGHTPEHIELLQGWAKKYGLIVTGGSDFHDPVKRPLGIGGINRRDLEIFLERVG